MKCQECPANNRTKENAHLQFFTFRCHHFNFVCSNCANNSHCKVVTGDGSVCGADRLTFRQQREQGRFPQRPWLQKEAKVLNDHRNEVLQWWNKPPTDFASHAKYEDYDEERAALAHNLNNDDSKIIKQSVEKMRVADVPTAVKIRRYKTFTTKVEEAESQLTKQRKEYEVRVQEETEKQARWLKRRQSRRDDHDYEIFASSSILGRSKKGRKLGDLLQNLDGVGGHSNVNQPRRINLHKRQNEDKLPEKPKRKYKFNDKSPHPKGERSNDFRAVGFNPNWLYERFMADIEGNWD